MLKSRVTVVTRTKNRALLLERAIESVLAQTFEDWGLVIVNDGGERAPVDALVESHRERLGSRVLVLHHEHSRGMEAATNAGLRASESDFVALLDDDDSWEREFLAATTSRLTAKPHPNVRGVVTHSTKVIEVIDGSTVREIRRMPYNGDLKQITLYRMAAQNVFANNAFVYERSVHDQIGFFREDLPVLGDWEFNLRFLRHWDIALIPLALSNYHQRPRPPRDHAYANTIHGELDKHLLYDAILRNEMLRADLEAGRLGLGLIVNQSKAGDELRRMVTRMAAPSAARTRLRKTAQEVGTLFDRARRLVRRP